MVADLFHPGHVAFLRAARQLGDHLTVHVLSDELVESHKGKRPVMNQAERVVMLQACRWADEVMTEGSVEETLSFMQQHRFDCYAFACASPLERQQKLANCAGLPRLMVVELDYTPGISTTQLIKRIKSEY